MNQDHYMITTDPSKALQELVHDYEGLGYSTDRPGFCQEKNYENLGKISENPASTPPPSVFFIAWPQKL